MLDILFCLVVVLEGERLTLCVKGCCLTIAFDDSRQEMLASRDVVGG